MGAPVKHKVSRHVDMAVCGAKRIDGAVFAWKLSNVTCAACVATVISNRAKAKARFAQVVR